MPLEDITYPNYNKPNLTQEELLNVHTLHEKWILLEEGGFRADFSRQDLTACDLTGLNFTGACFAFANLSGVACNNGIFQGALFQGTNLNNTDFCFADLTQATFSGADMTNVNLYHAQLCGVFGNGKEIKTIAIGQFPCAYTDTIIQFACQRHHITAWQAVTEPQLDAMDENAKIYHQSYFTILENIIVNVAPAQVSRYENTNSP